MPVIIDQVSLNADDLGIVTIGQVLSRVWRANRLVVRLVIDGDSPDLRNIEAIRNTPLENRTVFIETADPRQTAIDSLLQADDQLRQADQLKNETADLLRANQWTAALTKFAQCLQCWLETQQVVSGVARLLKIDLEILHAGDQTLARQLAEFAGQLRQIQSALEAGDLVGLTDLLVYETADTSDHWRAAVQAMRVAIKAA
jgi:hypothetical protein